MIDIGTNGEMVLGNKDRACNAAPQRQDRRLKVQRSNAACAVQHGAVDHVAFEDGEWTYTTVGNAARLWDCAAPV